MIENEPTRPKHLVPTLKCPLPARPWPMLKASRNAKTPTPPASESALQPKRVPITEEEKRDAAIAALNGMVLDDEDVAIVIVASPWRENFGVIIERANYQDPKETVRDYLNDVGEVQEFLHCAFSEEFERRAEELETRHEYEMEETRSEMRDEIRIAELNARRKEFHRIVNILKDGHDEYDD